MKSQTALLKPTKTSASPSTRVADEKPTSTTPGRVIYYEFHIPPKVKTRPGAIDIDDLVAEFEQTAEGAEVVAKGRQWVAETFYTGQPTVAQLRLQKGWSQAELARRAGTSQPYIARLELGKVDPQVSTVQKLAKALGVSLATAVQAVTPEDQE